MKESLKFSLNFLENKLGIIKTTYLEKVMDGKTLNALHWYVIACVHLIVSDESFEHLPSVTLVQHQVGRTLGLFWRMNPVRSFGCRRRKVIRLDEWNVLDGYQVHCWVIQVYCRGREFWNLGGRSLARLLLLWTSMTWKVTKVIRTGKALSLPNLDDRLLDNQRVASSWTWTSYSPSMPLVIAFPLFSIIVANLMVKRTELVIY